ncbi:MAG TPA: putative LPS assembly protein LptD, partial [Bacteroidota bacterium]|nr:putative LPS assembly protein LptD [Bacteroidota bacterium]
DKTSNRLGTLDVGVSANTRLYGIVQPNMFGVAAIRHTLQPSLSLTYRKQIVEEAFSPKQMLLGLSLGNIFEMKTIPDSANKEGTKITLMNLGASLSYDLAADSMHFSDLGLNARTAIGNILNIGTTADFDLYKLVETSPGVYTRVNQFEASGGRLVRLRSYTFSISTSLSGSAKESGHTEEVPNNPSQDTSTQHHMKSGFIGLYDNEEPNFNIPWSLSLGFDFSETKDPPLPQRSANMQADLSFNLTQNWKISGQASYDVLNRQVAAPSVVITRDLHCWIMDFTWVPTGPYRNYQFNIHIKSPQLQDIKLTKSGSDNDLR